MLFFLFSYFSFYFSPQLLNSVLFINIFLLLLLLLLLLSHYSSFYNFLAFCIIIIIIFLLRPRVLFFLCHLFVLPSFSFLFFPHSLSFTLPFCTDPIIVALFLSITQSRHILILLHSFSHWQLLFSLSDFHLSIM